MHICEPVNRSTTPPDRNALPAAVRTAAGCTPGSDCVATMEAQ